MTRVSSNLAQVRAKMAAAARRVGRRPDELTLVAVSKTRPADQVAAAVAAGATNLGENYVQEMVAKAQALAGGAAQPIRWHFIGHLQRNKVKYLVPFCTLIHSVDSPRLAAEIARRAEQAGRVQPLLLQVDLAGEQTKNGCPEAELPELVAVVRELPQVDWQGLMTITPFFADPEQARPFYRQLAAWRQKLLDHGVPAANLRHLSMGMSNDYEVAIEEGATLVRVGTAIFGPRD